jgi:hypothetical protein
MKVWQVLQEMTTADAAAIFSQFGVQNASALDPGALKKARNTIIMKNHQDFTGNKSAAQEINAAYDVLTNKPTIAQQQQHAANDPYWHPNAHKTYKPGPEGEDETTTDTGGGDYWNPHGADWYGSKYGGRGWGEAEPDPRQENPWVWAGYNGGAPPNPSIRRMDYTDMNFIKKSMWELSGKSQDEYTIWGFDGHFFRNSVTVYGSPQIFMYMAQAMVDWQTKGGNPYECRAVFISAPHDPNTLWLVYADGKFFHDPIGLGHNSMNANPGNDQSFTRRLPGYLDRLGDNETAMGAGVDERV